MQYFNDYEVKARAVKVQKMVDTINRMNEPHRSTIIEWIVGGDLDQINLCLLRQNAGINHPSDLTMRALQLRLSGVGA